MSLFNTQKIKPDTFSGYIEHTLDHIRPLYTDLVGSDELRTDKLLIKGNENEESSIIIHANPIEPTPTTPTPYSGRVWKTVVNEDNGVLSFNNNYSKNSDTEVESSTPIISLNPVRELTIQGNGEVMLHNSLMKRKSNTPYITLNDTNNEFLSASNLRDVGIFIQQPTSSYAIVLDTAENIFSSDIFPNLQIGHYVDFILKNTGVIGGGVILSFTMGTGLSVAPFFYNCPGGSTCRYRIMCDNETIPTGVVMQMSRLLIPV